MRNPLMTSLALAVSLAISGCAMLEPRTTEVAPAIPSQ